MSESSDRVPDRVDVGRIGSPYGIKGWVKLISFTEPRENLFSYTQLQARLDQGGLKAVEIDQFRPHGKGLIGHIVAYDTPEAVRELTGAVLTVDSEQLPALAPGEYYWHQLTGLQVWTQSGQLLGQVSKMLETGANDVLVVAATKDSIDDRERLIPWLPDHVVSEVDLQARKLVVDWEPDYLQ